MKHGEGSELCPEGDEAGRCKRGPFEGTNVEHRIGRSKLEQDEGHRGNQREEELDPPGSAACGFIQDDGEGQ